MPISRTPVVCNRSNSPYILHKRGIPRNPSSSGPSIVLCKLGLEPLSQLALPLRNPLMSLHLPLNPLARSQNFALQIKTAALLRIVQIKQPLKPLRHSLHLDVAHLAGSDVQDAAGLVHGDAGAEGRWGSGVVCRRVFLGGCGLAIGFGDGAAEDAGAGEDDLGYYAVGLGRRLDGVEVEGVGVTNHCDVRRWWKICEGGGIVLGCRRAIVCLGDAMLLSS
jgi:hypothetical protein